MNDRYYVEVQLKMDDDKIKLHSCHVWADHEQGAKDKAIHRYRSHSDVLSVVVLSCRKVQSGLRPA